MCNCVVLNCANYFNIYQFATCTFNPITLFQIDLGYLHYQYACITYAEQSSTKRVALIVGLTVGLAVFAVILAIVIVCVVRFHRKTQVTTATTTRDGRKPQTYNIIALNNQNNKNINAWQNSNIVRRYYADAARGQQQISIIITFYKFCRIFV